MKYRGSTEDERIECALHVQNLEEMAFYLRNAGLLTQNKADTLLVCRDIFAEEGAPQPTTGEQTPPDVPDAPTGPPAQKQPGTRRTLRTVSP